MHAILYSTKHLRAKTFIDFAVLLEPWMFCHKFQSVLALVGVVLMQMRTFFCNYSQGDLHNQKCFVPWKFCTIQYSVQGLYGQIIDTLKFWWGKISVKTIEIALMFWFNYVHERLHVYGHIMNRLKTCMHTYWCNSVLILNGQTGISIYTNYNVFRTFRTFMTKKMETFLVTVYDKHAL